MGKRKKRVVSPLFMVSFLIALTILYTGYHYLGKGESTDNVVSTAPKPGDITNVLVVGIAKNLSDSIMLCSFNKSNGDVTLLSIPRDTYYPRKGYNQTAQKKINAAYGSGGIDATVASVSDLLGVPIHYYIEVNYQAVIDVVDAIGGIPVTVPRNMKYDDPGDDLHIDFKEGDVISSGEDIVKVLRWRKNNKSGGYAQGDIGRVEMQQQVVKLGIEKLTEKNPLITFLKTRETLTKNIKTNMQPKEMLKYMFYARKIKSETITMSTLPGASKTIKGLSFYVVNEEELDLVLKNIRSES